MIDLFLMRTFMKQVVIWTTAVVHLTLSPSQVQREAADDVTHLRHHVRFLNLCLQTVTTTLTAARRLRDLTPERTVANMQVAIATQPCCVDNHLSCVMSQGHLHPMLLETLRLPSFMICIYNLNLPTTLRWNTTFVVNHRQHRTWLSHV